ncbi:hypothetical protein G20c_57 [Thermus phage G20c]|nr:hypothetical protein G20c_57 [Thermus phage G20c]
MPLKIYITNKRRGGKGIYVGRPSVLGNPFRLKSEADRDRVCELYRDWLNEKLKTNKAIRAELNRLYRLLIERGELELTCWCAPARCHAEEIAELLASAALQRGYEVIIEYKG